MVPFLQKFPMAMASVLPIFFSGDGEGADFVRKYKIGYVSKAGCIKSLNENIQKFAKIDALSIEKFKSNINDLLKNNFNYEKHQLELIKFIKSQI